MPSYVNINHLLYWIMNCKPINYRGCYRNMTSLAEQFLDGRTNCTPRSKLSDLLLDVYLSPLLSLDEGEETILPTFLGM